MFKPKAAGSLASKLAHTTTIPALGNKDLKLLQDLITNEKTVLTTLQKLAVDITRASESLKHWGLGEGEDLGDILSHATNIYAHISTALINFANHEHTVRAHLKSIRTREEKLDEMKRKRKSVSAKADAADKKLSKMSGENKNLPAQTELLTKLRDEIRQLDTEIMVEEAHLGDFKRLSTRNVMALKLGGLLEFGEKATIVGELGKLLIEEIPLDTTPPGQPRSFYQSHQKTDNLVAEVSRCIGEVVFTPPPDITESAPAPSTGPPLGYTPSESYGQGLTSDNTPLMVDPTLGYTTPDTRANTLNDIRNSSPPDPLGEFGESGLGLPHSRFGSGPTRTGDDSQRLGGGGQFSTFPVKMRVTGASGDQSFSTSVADALREPEIATGTGVGGSMPSVNVGRNPWDGDEYKDTHAQNESMESSQLPYIMQDQGHHRSDSRDGLSPEKGVRFRTPSMEVSGLGPIAPGVASPMDPGPKWGGRAPAPYDAPVSPVRPGPEDDLQEHDYSDERSRNSAAAREVALELDSMQFLPPSPQNYQQYGPPSPTIPFPLAPTRPLSFHSAASPLSASAAPLPQQRSVSPNHVFSQQSTSPSAPLRGASMNDGPTSYATPPDYPSASPISGAVTVPRTIFAAAFKRTPRSGPDIDPGKKRSLPSNPRPTPLRNTTQDNIAGNRTLLPLDSHPPENLPLQEPESPVASDYGSLGNVRVMNDETGSLGYNQNKFVTNLDD